MIKKRRDFVKQISIAGAGAMVLGPSPIEYDMQLYGKSAKAVGLVGMDTSHSPYFVKAINNSKSGYRVTTAYTTVSHDLPASANRVTKFTDEIKAMGVEVVDTIETLLDKVEFVLLCTVDGRLHLEQAEKILKAQKRVFIDKPMAASLPDVIKIFELSEQYNIPTFSCSAVRFMKKAEEIRSGAIGQVLGAQIFAPIMYEPTHPKFYWYGIHGAELLFTVMKQGCKRVKTMSTEKYSMIIGDWGEGKLGTYCGLKNGMQEYGGQVFGEDGVRYLDKFEDLSALVEAVLHYFDSGEIPVKPSETLELFAFMDAAQKSEEAQEQWVNIQDIL